MNIPKLCLIALLLAAAGTAAARAPAPALAPLPAAMPADTMPRALALAAEAARSLAPQGARVLVLPGALDARLKLAACAQVQPHLPAGVPAWGRTRVALRCTDGPVRWNVHLPVTVQVWAPAAVTRVALASGVPLEADQLMLADTDWAAAPSPPFADIAALAGRQLAHALGAAQPLRATDLQSRKWFAAGDAVRVVAQGAGFRIAAEGRALAAGFEGQTVRVRIGENHVAAGRAVGPRLVEVAL
ncbi:MAG: flagella basal body P-ring formation protein FlgA [Leptothrix sp. (in: Bacteria)]|nr:flagella basal body P-ring formation protein FlgA [Leptothrix sp. (in: b-proteobacteria)]